MKRADYKWALPAEITQRLGRESYGAQRVIHEREHLLVILHEPPKAGSKQREHAVFLRNPEGAWLCKGNAPGERALHKLLDDYRDVLDALAKRHDEASTADQLFQILGALLPLARAAGNLQATLQSAREAVKNDALLIDLRDQAVDIARGFELLLTDTRMGLDFLLAQAAEVQTRAALALSRAQQKLNAMAALTFPLMAVGAVFGMNLHHGAEGAAAWLFWAVLGAGLVFGLVLMRWVRTPAAVAAPAAGLSPSGLGPRKKA